MAYQPLVCPPLAPRVPPPLQPRRGEGELKQPICLFALGLGVLNRSVAVRVCWPRWGNVAVVVNGLGLGAAAAAARRGVCKVSAANEHTLPVPFGRAEQRSGARIRAGACLSVASLRPTPGGASSARYPKGARPLARLSFAHLFFGEAKKSEACGRQNTGPPDETLSSKPCLSFVYFSLAKQRKVRPAAGKTPAHRTKPGLPNTAAYQ